MDSAIKPVFGGRISTCMGVAIECLPNGRYKIAIGQPGFNCPANNGAGYDSPGRAAIVSKGYATRSARR